MDIARRTLAVLLAVIPAASVADEPGASLKLFDGSPKVFVVNGYSTSRHWPRVLQRKLDRYFDGKRVIEVQQAIKGGTPIAKWMDVATGERRPAWNEVLKPKLQRDDDRPVIVLAQQSLQWAYGERSEGIRGPDDGERIERGADILQRYATTLLNDGADRVFIAMHIYKRQMEPAIGNERLALSELMKRKLPNVHAGPDVWAPTKEHFPQAFASDRRHPNDLGAEIMAQMWFETLLRHDGLDAPDWSRKELPEALRSNSNLLSPGHDLKEVVGAGGPRRWGSAREGRESWKKSLVFGRRIWL